MPAIPTCPYPPMFAYTSMEFFFFTVCQCAEPVLSLCDQWVGLGRRAEKKKEGCVATTVACFSSSINPSLNQWGWVHTLWSSQSVWELERDASSAGGPTEWRVERRRCGMKTEVLEGRDGWKQSKLIEGKQTSRETASIRGRSVNASDLQFGKLNSAEVVLEKM